MNNTTSKLDSQKLQKGRYVLVETRENSFEIGIVREIELKVNEKNLKILILTDADFETLPPMFDPDWLPFLPNGTRDVDLDAHPVYSIETKEVISLIAQQKQYLEHQLPAKQTEFDEFKKMEEMLLNLYLEK